MTRYETRIFMSNIDYGYQLGVSANGIAAYGYAKAAYDPLERMLQREQEKFQRMMQQNVMKALAYNGPVQAAYGSVARVVAPAASPDYRSRLLLLCPINP